MQESEEGQHSIPIIRGAHVVPECCSKKWKRFFLPSVKIPPRWLLLWLVLLPAPKVLLNWGYLHLTLPYKWLNFTAPGASHKTGTGRSLVLTTFVKKMNLPSLGIAPGPISFFTRLSKTIKAEHRHSQGYEFYWYFQENTKADKAEWEVYLGFVQLLFCHCDLYNSILRVLHCYKR